MKRYLIIILIFAVSSCSSYSPFESKKQNKFAKTLIKYKLKNWSDKIIMDDSIFLETYISLNKKLKDTLKKTKFDLLVKRRVDSFYLKTYTKEELLTLLKMDREFFEYGIVFERIEEKKGVNYAEFNSVNEAKKFVLKTKNKVKAALKDSVKVNNSNH